MLHNVAHGVLYKYQNEGVVRNLSKKVQLTKIYGLVFIAAAFFSSAILAPVQPAGAASVTITTTKISPAQKPVSLTGSSFVVNYCNEDKDGGTNDCDNGTTPVTFNKEGGKFIARDVDYSDRTSLITRNTCNYNINVWYGANSSTANLTPEYRGGGPCSQFSERSIAVIPANITLAPPAKIQLGGVHHALYIPSDHPPVDISGNSISLKFCQLNTLNKNVDNTTRPTTSACPSVGTVTLYKQGDAFVENSIDISGAAYTCNYGLRAVIGQGAGNVTISKNGGNPCPDGVDDGNTTFTISSASMCESKYPAGSVRDACMAGALDANKANDAFCDETYAGKPAELTACKAGQDATKNLPPPEADDSSGEQASTCTVEAVGWLVCPVMKFTATLNDGLSGFLFSSLEFKAEFLKTDSGAYKAWQSFLNIANVMFVIAFMAIVLSQVTSIGISNYGIKKLLPKLVIVAILVNISYYICQLAVDISNLLGYSLKGLLDSVRPATTATGVNWVEIIGLGLMSGVALIGLFLAISVPVLFAAFLSLASAALIIFAQKSIVILLTVLSPLAFVAMLLPNTEKLFKRWREIFTSMLILFPTVSLLFGAGNLASAILMEAAGDDPGMKIAALGAGVLPLLAIIPLLQNALKSTGALGAKLSGLNQKANGRIGKKIGDSSMLGAYKKAYDRNQQIKRAQITGGVYKGKNPFTRAVTRMNAGINNSRLSGNMGTRTAQQAASMANKLEIENVEAANAQIEQANLTPEALKVLATGGKVAGLTGSDASTRAAATLQLAAAGEYGGVADAWDDVRTSGSKEDRRVFAQALARSKDRPAWIGQGALAQFRQADNGAGLPTHDQMAVEQINSGAYSAEALAGASRQELDYVNRLIDTGATSRANTTVDIGTLSAAADDVMTDPEMRKGLGKNRSKVVGFTTTAVNRGQREAAETETYTDPATGATATRYRNNRRSD